VRLQRPGGADLRGAEALQTKTKETLSLVGVHSHVTVVTAVCPQHLSAEELALRREEMKRRQPRPCKTSRFRG